jgi:FkbM family methyltransferase
LTDELVSAAGSVRRVPPVSPDVRPIVTNLLRRVRNRLATLGELRLPFRQVSYSDAGEDLLADKAFQLLGIERPGYIDFGANHPVRFNNTYRFYRRGGTGVCVEPNPDLAPLFRRYRARDLLIPAGVTAAGGGRLTFYSFDNPGVSTFSKAQAEQIERTTPYRVRATIEVAVLGVNEVFERAAATGRDFVSLDCEGLDLEILRGLDFARFRPAVVCVETVEPGPDQADPARLGTRIAGIPALLTTHGYRVFADTYVNTIFADAEQLRFPTPAPE